MIPFKNSSQMACCRCGRPKSPRTGAGTKIDHLDALFKAWFKTRHDGHRATTAARRCLLRIQADASLGPGLRVVLVDFYRRQAKPARKRVLPTMNEPRNQHNGESE